MTCRTPSSAHSTPPPHSTPAYTTPHTSIHHSARHPTAWSNLVNSNLCVPCHPPPANVRTGKHQISITLPIRPRSVQVSVAVQWTTHRLPSHVPQHIGSGVDAALVTNFAVYVVGTRLPRGAVHALCRYVALRSNRTAESISSGHARQSVRTF